MTKVKKSVKNLPKRERAIVGVVIGVFVVVIMAAVITLVSRMGKVEVMVKFAPFDARVSLNGTEVKNNSSSYIAPGTYTVVAEREHFETKTETVTISESNKHILGKLMASDEEGERIMEERAEDYLAVEGVMGGLANEEGAAIKEKWPILKYLPVNNQFYSISYAYDEARKPVVRVWAVDDYMMEIARQKMESWGVSLEGLEIEYVVGD